MFPEFLLHHAYTYLWNRLYSGFPAFQLALLDGDDVVAEAHALSIPWDGSIEGLPAGWGPAFELGMTTDLLPTALSMLSIGVLPSRQGEGLGARMLEASRDAARAEGLATVLAPVRPMLKDRYPLVPVEEYVTWGRPDGSHFDPWIRLHERAGADIAASAPESLAIEAHVADWERWTGMALPTDGDYVVPNMLAPLVVRGGIGRHAEPNVWMRHRLS